MMTQPPPAPAAELTPGEIRAIHMVAFDQCDWTVMRLCREALGVNNQGGELPKAYADAAKRRLAAMQARGEI